MRLLLQGFGLIHTAREDFKDRALREHKERRRLVQLAAMMSDDDCEHAGPVERTDEEIADAQIQRHKLQDKMDNLKTELSMHLDSQNPMALLCLLQLPFYQFLMLPENTVIGCTAFIPASLQKVCLCFKLQTRGSSNAQQLMVVGAVFWIHDIQHFSFQSPC